MELIKNVDIEATGRLRTDIQIQRYRLQDLAQIYGISKPTMRKWLKPYEEKIGPREGHWYTAQQVEVIFDIFLLPDEISAIKKVA